jgi:Ca2+-transporting ATPase
VRWPAVLLRQFLDALILVLLAAALVSLLMGAFGDALTILAIVLLNGLLGFTQEWRAERAMRALRRMLAPRCRVLRDGEERALDARELAPGDVVLLESGDRVPADLRLFETVDLELDESALTGESTPVLKQLETVPEDAPLAERRSMAWMGTVVTNGHGHGVAVATGMGTEFGRIARLTAAVEDEATPLQLAFTRLGRQIGALALVVSALVALTGWFLGRPAVDMFFTGVSLAVAVVPEGLPAVVTITLALGVRAMVRRKALLRRLQATEALGAATVICTDKTGTLTENEMTVTRVWTPAGEFSVTGTGYEPRGHFELDGAAVDVEGRPDLIELLETALACNHARLRKRGGEWAVTGEPTEAALVVAAAKAERWPREPDFTLSEFSFNSTRKRMTVIEHRPGGRVAHVKGAPEVVLARCARVRVGAEERELTDADRSVAEAATEALAGRGLRTLAVARRVLPERVLLDEDLVERELTLLGVVGIIDPPRPEVSEAIRVAGQAGIRVLMITGDAAPTAASIAQRVGLAADRVVSGDEVERMSDKQLKEILRGAPLFARTIPEHKLRIVGALQELGHVAAMTGDGVNDAPALKKADIGIAMGRRGTDVARGASDMILTDDNFASIIGAIEEGRRQYDNIRKFVRYLLSSNTGEVVAILLTTAILDRVGMLVVLGIGAYIGLAVFWLFQRARASSGPDALVVAQTLAFTAMIVLEKVNVLNFRVLGRPLTEVGVLSNRWLLGALAAMIGLQVCAVYVPFLQRILHTAPLDWRDWGTVVVAALPVFVVVEVWKWGLAARERRAAQPD